MFAYEICEICEIFKKTYFEENLRATIFEQIMVPSECQHIEKFLLLSISSLV